MKKAVIFFICALFANAAFAGSSIRVEAPNVVGLDEQFNVTFIIEGDERPSEFSWEPGGDFKLVWGPQKGSSTSISIINGKRTRSSQHTYTYILAPKRTGAFSLSSAIAEVGGEVITTGAIKIEVVSNGGSSSSQSSSRSSGGEASSGSEQVSPSGDISREDLFMQFSLSRKHAVIGEPITAVLKLYQRVNIAGFEGAKFPTFNGFWSQETERPSNIEFTRESLNDKIYNTAVLRRYVLIPQRAGDLVIDPAELVCLLNVRVRPKGGSSIFDGFFDDDYTTVRKRITTPSVTVKVKPLPSGAPSSFGGGVGQFSIKAGLDKDSLKTHEAASLVVTISGKGNVSLLEAPKVSFPPGLEVYDTKSKESVDKNTGGTAGSKIFEYPLIPRSHGDFTVGPIEYSYYDVHSGKYVTLKTAPLYLHVQKGNEEADSPVLSSSPSPSVRKGVKNLGEDIRFIVTRKPSLRSGAGFFVGTPMFYIIALLSILSALLYWFASKRVAARRADVAGTKNRKATKMALRRLQQAEDFLKKDLYTAFYEELHKALLGFISDKLNMGMEELSKDNIAGQLRDGGVPKELADRFVAILDACEYSRYSPDSGNKAMAEHYADAVETISSIDINMKGNKKGHAPKILAVLSSFILMSHAVSAAEDTFIRDSLWNAGVEAYSSGQWQEAVSSWNSLIVSGIEETALYYNIGNAYFKSGEYPKAVLNYERALKINPSASDLRYNLDFVRTLLQDKIEEVPDFILVSWSRRLSYMLSSDTWAVIALIFFIITLSMALLFLLSSSSAGKRAGFYTALASLLICALSFGFAKSQQRDYMKADSAIIMRPVTAVKSSPSSESSKDLFILHEGTKVRVLDTVGEWMNVELADGRQGWILSKELEMI